jgi:hypothetical protein
MATFTGLDRLKASLLSLIKAMVNFKTLMLSLSSTSGTWRITTACGRRTVVLNRCSVIMSWRVDSGYKRSVQMYILFLLETGMCWCVGLKMISYPITHSTPWDSDWPTPWKFPGLVHSRAWIWLGLTTTEGKTLMPTPYQKLLLQ